MYKQNVRIIKKINPALTALASLSVIVGVFFALFQLQEIKHQTIIQSETLTDGKKVASAQFIYNIGRDIDNNHQTDAIANAIDDNKSDYPLLKPEGTFTESDITDYIGPYDTVGNMNNDNLIDKQLAYDEFSYDVEKAYCNKDIQQVIYNYNNKGTITGLDSYYYGFTTLAKQFFKMDKNNCKVMDSQ